MKHQTRSARISAATKQVHTQSMGEKRSAQVWTATEQVCTQAKAKEHNNKVSTVFCCYGTSSHTHYRQWNTKTGSAQISAANKFTHKLKAPEQSAQISSATEFTHLLTVNDWMSTHLCSYGRSWRTHCGQGNTRKGWAQSFAPIGRINRPTSMGKCQDWVSTDFCIYRTISHTS